LRAAASIINTASVVGCHLPRMLIDCATTKVGIVALSKALAVMAWSNIARSTHRAFVLCLLWHRRGHDEGSKACLTSVLYSAFSKQL